MVKVALKRWSLWRRNNKQGKKGNVGSMKSGLGSGLRSRGGDEVRKGSAEKNTAVAVMAKCLLCSYIVTVLLLLLLALLLYKVGVSESNVAIAIIVIYVLATFLGGLIAGKEMQSRKFLWGALLGVSYFIILAIISVGVNHSVAELGDSFMSAFVLCTAGGMLGGMLG